MSRRTWKGILALLCLGSGLLSIPSGAGAYAGTSSSTPLCNVEEIAALPSKFIIRGVTSPYITWTDVRISLVVAESAWTTWDINSNPLSGGSNSTETFLSGGKYCNVTDRAGDGLFDKGDYFVIDYIVQHLEGPVIEQPSDVWIVYEPTGESMWKGQFNGSVIPFEPWESELSSLTPWIIVGGVLATAAVVAVVFIWRRHRT